MTPVPPLPSRLRPVTTGALLLLGGLPFVNRVRPIVLGLPLLGMAAKPFSTAWLAICCSSHQARACRSGGLRAG